MSLAAVEVSAAATTATVEEVPQVSAAAAAATAEEVLQASKWLVAVGTIINLKI